jgi:hypothetical protein
MNDLYNQRGLGLVNSHQYSTGKYPGLSPQPPEGFLPKVGHPPLYKVSFMTTDQEVVNAAGNVKQPVQ